jgi:hypothetical protein
MSGPPDLAACYAFLAEHDGATWFDLIEQGLMSSGSLLEPEHVLASPVDPDCSDLVEEFRRSPLGPYSERLQLLLWRLRAQQPAGRYVLRQTNSSRWQVLRLAAERRPSWELIDTPELATIEECEWAVFALRWRDHTGQVLPLRWGG